MEKGQILETVKNYLKKMVEADGSDLFIAVDFPPAMKVYGNITTLSEKKMTAEETKAFAYAIMNERQIRDYEANRECNFAIAAADIGRFRVSVFMQQGVCGFVIRTIKTDVPSIDELGMPDVLKTISMNKDGLVVIVGGTGCGKSTSLAAMINHRNENSHHHIITVEDPIEYVHPHKNCIITQREVGVDCDSWDIALKNSLRQAPDVILLGEIRDSKTMDFCIAFSETGHLALSTLHANNANQALDRIINFFPESKRQQLLLDLSLNIRAITSQRLLKSNSAEKKGRVAAFEIMLNTPLITDMILKGDVHGIKEVMAKSNELGMKTFDQSLFDLYEADLITLTDALRNADSMNELRLRIKLEGKVAQDADIMENLEGLSLTKNDEESGMIS